MASPLHLYYMALLERVCCLLPECLSAVENVKPQLQNSVLAIQTLFTYM